MLKNVLAPPTQTPPAVVLSGGTAGSGGPIGGGNPGTNGLLYLEWSEIASYSDASGGSLRASLVGTVWHASDTA